MVLSTHGRRGTARLLLGSIAEEVVRTSTVPTLTVTEQSKLWKVRQRILVPVDFSECSMHAVEAAARLSRLLSLNVHLLHVLEPTTSPYLGEALVELAEPPQEEQRASAVKQLEELAERAGLQDQFQTSIAIGSAKDRILQLAQTLDPALLVLGSHGRRGFGRVVLGSVAETVVREAHRPTLIVKNGDSLDAWPGAAPPLCREQPPASDHCDSDRQ